MLKLYEKPELEYKEFEVENITDVSTGTGDGTDVPQGPGGMG